MRCAADFRSLARSALKGKWGLAVIAGLLAGVLGAVSVNGPEVNLDIGDSGIHVAFELAGQQIFTTATGWSPQFTGLLLGGAVYLILVALVMAVAFHILGSVIEVGYARFNLELVDRKKEPELATLFQFFTYWKTTAVTRLLQGLYIFAWSLLLIVPGIIAGYSYAMTGKILAEHPELTATEAINRSKEMMAGNRWRLFCLDLSFIGWEILSSLTMGIGNLWLTPYKQAAKAAFYREISAVETAGPEF